MTTILIVDDEPDTLVVLEWLLHAEGFEVRRATDGAQAWALVRNQVPDLVITDYMMPRMDGVELCTRIRQTIDRQIPIILTSAASTLPDQQAKGFDAVMKKPIDFARLIQMVRTLLASASTR